MWTTFFPRTAAARLVGVGGIKDSASMELHHLQEEPFPEYVVSNHNDETSETVRALIGAPHDAVSNPIGIYFS